MNSFIPLLHVHIIWHPAAANTVADIARSIRTQIDHNEFEPFQREIGIPVFFHSECLDHNLTPWPIDWDQSTQTIVVVLIEGKLMRDRHWVQYVRDLHEEAKPEIKRHIIPIGLTSGAHNLLGEHDDLLTTYTQIDDSELQKKRTLRVVVQELCRHLGASPVEVDCSPRPVQLFISHTKRDEKAKVLAGKFKSLVENNPLGRFFDTVSIAPGYSLSKEIEAGLKSSAIVILRTDTYANSPWCQFEVITGKDLHRPMVIIDGLKQREHRSLPEMSNLPSHRLSSGESEEELQESLDEVMVEILAYMYAHEYLKHLVNLGHLPSHATLLARPPEDGDLLDILRDEQKLELTSNEKHTPLVIYPDPPISDVELRKRQRVEGVSMVTPLTSQGEVLKDKILGISISGAEDKAGLKDMAVLGLDKVNLDVALFNFSQQAIAHGAHVAYGGDLRPGGFTEDLFELLHARKAAGLYKVRKAYNYLAWPLHLNADDKWWSENMDVAELISLNLPNDLLAEGLDPSEFIAPNTPFNNYVWGRCLTSMRQEMTSTSDGRILVCGKWQNYKGRYPGILEEALLTLKAKKPLYPLGGFGGVTKMIVETLNGNTPQPLTNDFQRSEETYALMMDEHNQRHPDDPIDFNKMVTQLHQLGLDGLNNGLSQQENSLLVKTKDIRQAMILVFEGLRRLYSGKEE